MSSFLDSLDIPKRLPLSSQAANSIRKGIAEGTWQDYLPSERRLCEMFQVSRPTIRTALHQLSKEGLLDIRQGRRNRLISSPNNSAKQSRLVGLVTHQPSSQLTPFAYQGISEMRTHLAEQGFTTIILVCPPGSSRAQQKKLEEFLRQNRVFCCVLLSVSLDIQHWFSSHTVPALVLGSCHPDVNLPSLDIDYYSVCKHAAGTFLGKGHRRIALLIPDTKVAGDITSENGFRDAVTQHSPDETDAHAVIIRHNGTARNIGSRLDAQFNAPTPPTALLVAKPQFVFAVIIYLLKRGLTVPDTVSFISRDSHLMFENVSPPISHYSFGEESYAHRLTRMMIQMVSQGSLSPEPHLIFPEYSGNGTVKSIR